MGAIENSLIKQVIRSCENAGCRIVGRVNSTGGVELKKGGYMKPCTIEGIPDIVGAMPDGRFFGVEVKTKKGAKLRPSQQAFARDLLGCGGCFWIVDDMHEALTMREKIRHAVLDKERAIQREKTP